MHFFILVAGVGMGAGDGGVTSSGQVCFEAVQVSAPWVQAMQSTAPWIDDAMSTVPYVEAVQTGCN